MATYLKQHYLHDHKLAQRALLEFSRALKSGRLIAFTGAMTTEAFGYGSWGALQKQFVEDALAILAVLRTRHVVLPHYQAEISKSVARIKGIGDFSLNNAHKLGANVAFSLIEEVLDQVPVNAAMLQKRIAPFLLRLDASRPLGPRDDLRGIKTPLALLRLVTALRFRGPRTDAIRGESDFHLVDMPRTLVRDMGIRRFASLNYDFELERATMLGTQPKFKTRPAHSRRIIGPFPEFAALEMGGDSDSFQWNLGSGRIRRVLSDGRAAESDILNRERIDRMLEFAIGTDDVDYHVMHLHGRACSPASMLVSYRDYDRLYRHNDLHRLPFEHAKKLMIGGNPILFIGLGMSEPEVNRELEEFISNNPYRRVAPTFLLWNSDAGAMGLEERKLKRLDWLHRLGVLTIFDSDLEQLGSYRAASREQIVPCMAHGIFDYFKSATETEHIKKHNSGQLLSDLAAATRAMSETATLFGDREEYIPDTPMWRTMAKRIEPEKDKPAYCWKTEYDDPVVPGFTVVRTLVCRDEFDSAMHSVRDNIASLFDKGHMVCVIGASGAGKGRLARLVAECADCGGVGDRIVAGSSPHTRMIINGGFSFDTDSMLDAIALFIGGINAKYLPKKGKSRSQFFRDDGLYSANIYDASILIIINGMERFFGTDGHPLSAEFDELLQLAAATKGHRRVKWLFFGTERIRDYMETQLRSAPNLPSPVRLVDLDDVFAKVGFRFVDHEGAVPGNQLAETQQRIGWAIRSANQAGPPWRESCIETLNGYAPAAARELRAEITAYKAQLPGRISGDIGRVRRAFYNLCLDPDVLEAALPKGHRNAELAMEIMRVLAFVGTPAEAAVVCHAPKIRNRAGFCTADVQAMLDTLVGLGLVLKISGFQDYCGDEPCDTPPPRFALHRSLMTEIRYRFGIPLSEAKLSTAFNMSLYIAQPADGFIPEAEVHDELGHLIDRLIGSFKDLPTSDPDRPWSGLSDPDKAVVQGVFQTEDPVRARADHEQGTARSEDPRIACFYRLCLPESIQCLRAALAVIRGYYSTTGILTLDKGDRLIREDRDGILLEHAERLDTLIDGYGKLAKARAALRKAFDEIDTARFCALFGDAEPFYADELVWLHNERGVVRLAMGDLYEARRSFTLAMDVNRRFVEYDDRAHNWRRIRLNQLTVDIESGEIDLALRKIEEIRTASRGVGETAPFKRLREDKLALAIADGYEGFCLHLRGHRRNAGKKYEAAIAALSTLDELRAQAYFARLRASAATLNGTLDERMKALDSAHDLALAARQLDIAYRIQVLKADAILFAEVPDQKARKSANRMLEDAMRYALQTDTHRVRCEAAGTIARARYETGDYEGALSHAIDALTIAVRYGLELRKMTLRSLVGRILAARGHPVTAEHLAMTAIRVASRQKIQTAIDHAEHTLREIPQLSSITSSNDLSGRRNY